MIYQYYTTTLHEDPIFNNNKIYKFIQPENGVGATPKQQANYLISIPPAMGNNFGLMMHGIGAELFPEYFDDGGTDNQVEINRETTGNQ